MFNMKELLKLNQVKVLNKVEQSKVLAGGNMQWFGNCTPQICEVNHCCIA